MPTSLPIIDIGPLRKGEASRALAQEIHDACTTQGFFYVTGHGVDETLQQTLEQLCRQFFSQDLPTKQRIAMEHGGSAWRGDFALGDELTSGAPDQKESRPGWLRGPVGAPRLV